MDATAAAALAAVTPSRTDVIAMKAEVLRRLTDGEPVHAEEVLVDPAAPPHERPDSNRHVVLGVSGDDDRERMEADRVVLYWRRLAACTEAVAELLAQGLIVPCQPLEQRSFRAPFSEQTATIPVERPGTRGGVSFPHGLPQIPAEHRGYRLVHGLRGRPPHLFDADLFTAGLMALELDDRVRRTIEESLNAFRRGLYLAAASLLAAATEGAWYAAAVPFVDKDRKLGEAMERDRTADVQTRVANHLRDGADGRDRARTDGLEVHARLMRDIRNYGLHPRSTVDDELERFFSEEAVALLVLNTHHHLVTLAELGETALSRR